jgi:predicted RNA-binding protein with TRAM domain
MAHNIPSRTGLRQERSKFSGNKRRAGDYTSKRVSLPPFVRGQQIEVTVEEIGHRGHGIAHDRGFTILVPNTSIGEKVKARVWRVQRTLVFTTRLEKARLAPGRGEQKRVPKLARSRTR